MYLSSNDDLSSSGTGVIPPGSVPKTCVSNCNTPLPVIKDSLGNPVNIGDFWTEQGGYYSGLFTLTGKEVYALILSPKNIGHIQGYKITNTTFDNTILSSIYNDIDGMANTTNILNYLKNNNILQSYPIYNRIEIIRNTSTYNDWYIPTKQELGLIIKYFKPNNLNKNYVTQNINGKNIFPCNLCSLSNFTQTTYSNFVDNGSECINSFSDYTIDNASSLLTSSKFDNTQQYFYHFSYKNGSNIYGYNYFNYNTPTYINNTALFSNQLQCRLVRRVLVS